MGQNYLTLESILPDRRNGTLGYSDSAWQLGDIDIRGYLINDSCAIIYPAICRFNSILFTAIDFLPLFFHVYKFEIRRDLSFSVLNFDKEGVIFVIIIINIKLYNYED